MKNPTSKSQTQHAKCKILSRQAAQAERQRESRKKREKQFFLGGEKQRGRWRLSARRCALSIPTRIQIVAIGFDFIPALSAPRRPFKEFIAYTFFFYKQPLFLTEPGRA